MRLYTRCHFCGQNFYLSVVYPSRRDIPAPLQFRCLYCQDVGYYNRNEIWAEPGVGAPLAGAALGALVGGLIGGPIGLLLGGALGGTAGVNSEQQDRESVQRFNKEMV